MTTPDKDSINVRLRVAQSIIGQTLHNLRELADVLHLLAIEAHDRDALSDESFETLEPALRELGTLLTRQLELFPPEGS